MAVITGADDLVGTGDGDLIVRRGRASGAVTGGGGNDALIGDGGAVTIDTSADNATRRSAISLDAPALWTTGADALVGDSSVPHTAVLGVGAGQVDFFKVTLEAGATLTLDIDFAGDNDLGGITWHPEVYLLDARGAVIDFSRGSSSDDGGLGSPWIYGLDPYLTATVETAGTYYIRVGETSGPEIGVGRSYMLNVSATGHQAAAETYATDERLDGGDGNDFLVGGGGNDTLIGGGGNRDDYHGGDGDDVMVGGGARDFLYGDDGDDRAAGDASNDVISGGNGDDVLIGGQGYDILNGGEGADRLVGGVGNDVLTGGAGADTFVLYRAAATPKYAKDDFIYDFETGQDHLALKHGMFDLARGPLDAAAFHLGTAAVDADDRLIYDQGSGALWFDADGSGAEAAIRIATLDNHATLSAADIVVI